MKTATIKSNRGGLRHGAGRPKIASRRVTFSIVPEADNILQRQDKQAEFINKAIIAFGKK